MAEAPGAWLFARAYLDLGRCALALRTMGLQRLLAHTPTVSPDAPVRLEDVRRARRYGRFIRTAARFHVLRPQCLPRSLVLHSWLRRQGLPSQLRLGVRKEAGAMLAHAWVELDRRVVNDRRTAVAAFAPLGAAAGPWWYRLYGLLVRSDVRLPFPALTPAQVGREQPAWVIERGDPASRLPRPDRLGWKDPAPHPDAGHTDDTAGDMADEDGEGGYVVHRAADGSLWWWCPAGTFHAQPAARRVAVFPEDGADERSLAVVLVGPLAAFISCQMGYPTLHASAVVTPAGAVAFLGPKGRGKSTLAGMLLRRGATLLTDDLLQLRAVPAGSTEGAPDGSTEGAIHGVPGPPFMRVWRQTAHHTLGVAADALPLVSSAADKRLLALDSRSPFAAAPHAAPLRAIYVLDRCPPEGDAPTAEIAVRDLSGREALAALLANLSSGACLTPAEMTRALPLLTRLVAQARVRLLRYPTGFQHQDAVAASVLGALAESEGRA